MSQKPKPPSRTHKTALQVFVSPVTHARFRAACAFAGEETSAIAEKLLTEFADRMGIPSQLPPRAPRSK